MTKQLTGHSNFLSQINYGPMKSLNQKRPEMLSNVAKNTLIDLEKHDLDMLIGEALFNEKARLRRQRAYNPSYFFTLKRRSRDLFLWKNVNRGLLKPSSVVPRDLLLNNILNHYSEEIGGRFRPPVYKLATRAIPYGFRWFLNAVSVKNFRPWSLTENIESLIKIQGEVEHLQKLSKKGTILLVPTHMSNIDSVLIGYVILLMNLPPFSYGAGLNLFSNPILSFFMGSLGAYTVDRQKNSIIYKNTLKNYSTEILRNGIHSVFFPGGGRSRSGGIESKLKLGLLGTGLNAQIANHIQGKSNPNIYIVPMVTSFHFVIEAASLIESYLLQQGQARFMGADTAENPMIVNLPKFIYKFFATKTSMTVSIGRPLDVFGNYVDEEGRSIGPNGTFIQPQKWLTTGGELKSVESRDQEYTRELGHKISDSYYENNVVLSSHLVAFSYFQTLRKKYPEIDLFRFLRLSYEQRSISLKEYYKETKIFYEKICKLESAGKLKIDSEIKNKDQSEWIREGVRHLGLLHDAAVVKIENNKVTTDDMNLLYYYRNRLSGYGLSLNSETGRPKILRGENDEKGFLA